MDLVGRTVLVTGGARGIGKAIAEGFARRGARVAIADLGSLESSRPWAYPLSGAAELAATASALARAGAAVVSFEVDVTDAASCAALVDSVVARFGGLDVLVNAAGLLKTGLVRDYAEADWDRLFAVNTKGVFLMSRAAIPALCAARGAIVNLSSVCGKAGYPLVAAYCATKFAVIGLTQALAQELAAEGVRVNAVCPGLVPTAMVDHLESSGVWSFLGHEGPEARRHLEAALVPLGRFQTAEEVAEAVLYLATAPSVTGSALVVSGGQLMS